MVLTKGRDRDTDVVYDEHAVIRLETAWGG